MGLTSKTLSTEIWDGAKARVFGRGITPLSLVALFHVLLGVILTYPLILRISDHTIAADQSGDQYQTIWFFWWMKKSLLALQNPYWTDYLYFPHGTGLAYHLSPSTNVFAILLSMVTGSSINSPLVFNLMTLGSFSLCGISAFLLVRQITTSGIAGFLGSILVAGSPYRMWNLNHLNLLSLGWGILAFYFFLRLISQPRVRHALFSASFLVILFYASLSDALFTVVFVIVYSLFNWRRVFQHPFRKLLLKQLFIGGAVAVLLVLPGLWQISVTGSAWDQKWQDLITYSADALAFVVPPSETTAISGWIGSSRVRDSGYAPDAFLGWLLLAAVSLGIVLGRRSKLVELRWLGVAGVFFLLSLGPSLRIGDSVYLDGLMPYRLIYDSIPYLTLSRTPIRFVVLSHLSLVVFVSGLAAFWCAEINKRVRPSESRAILFSVVACSLILIVRIESCPTTIELWHSDIPEVYQDLRSTTSAGSVLELPVRFPGPLHNRYMYWQTVHELKSANGYLTHPSPGATDLLAQISEWDEVTPLRAASLVSLGINVVVIRDPDRPGTEPRLVKLRGR